MSFSCDTIENRPAQGPMPTCTLGSRADLAGELPVVLHDLGLAEPWSTSPHREGHQPLVAREVLRADTLDVVRGVQLASNHQAASEVFGLVAVDGPEPESSRARIALVGVLGGVRDGDQSRSVVTPASIASSEPR